MKRFKKIMEWVVSIFVVIVFIISAFALIGSINGRKDPKGVGSVFGKVLNTVQSDSMEDTLFEGDLIIGTLYDNSPLAEGQIITFRQKDGDKVILNTHRISHVDTFGDTTYYETKGDNEDGRDSGYRTAADIVAVYDFRIPYVGFFIDGLKTPVGFIICVILPIVAVIVYEAYKIIMIILKNRDEAILAAQPSEEPSEDVKAEIIREYLEKEAARKREAAMRAAEKAEKNSTENISDIPTEENENSDESN